MLKMSETCEFVSLYVNHSQRSERGLLKYQSFSPNTRYSVLALSVEEQSKSKQLGTPIKVVLLHLKNSPAHKAMIAMTAKSGE